MDSRRCLVDLIFRQRPMDPVPMWRLLFRTAMDRQVQWAKCDHYRPPQDFLIIMAHQYLALYLRTLKRCLLLQCSLRCRCSRGCPLTCWLTMPEYSKKLPGYKNNSDAT